MIEIKQQIPNEEALKKLVDVVFEKGVIQFVTNTRERREAVRKNRLYFWLLVVVFIFSVVVLFWSSNHLSQQLNTLVSMYLLALVFGSIIFVSRWYRELKILAQEINMALVPTITTCFGRLVLYTHDEVHRRETEAMFRESQLITTKVDNIVSDDMYSFFEPYPTTVRELKLDRTDKNEKGEVTTASIFHGVLVEVVLPKTLTGTTFLSTESESREFSHSNFWSDLLSQEGIVETQLEWNEFERDFHMATNNPTEALYILTPNFMLDLHSWWSKDKKNIRIVFKGNKMFMLLPDETIKIASTTTSTDPAELKKYALSVLKPLWRTLTLVEDIRL